VSHLDLLESEIQRFRIELSDIQKAALVTYCDELVRWNKRMNLSALSGLGLVRRLVVEPIWIGRELGLKGFLVDIGSGNGSPAIPFQISCPLASSHLFEARAKRAAFLRHLTVRLGLSNMTVHRARFEDVAAATVHRPDFISLRAVALNERLLTSIQAIAGPTTAVLWISSPEVPSLRLPFKALTVPITGSRVLLFQLDLS